MVDRSITHSLCAAIVAVIVLATPTNAGPVENRELVDAAWALDVKEVKKALASGASGDSYSLYFVDRSPVTAIGAVAMASRPELRSDEIEMRAVVIARLLFQHGASFAPNDLGILHLPITRGHRNLVELLLEKGASPTHRQGGYTPTELAVKSNEKAIYDLLIANGGKAVNERDAAQIALVDAVWYADDHLKMRKAIKDGARINAPDVSGTTPLFSALAVPVYDADHAATVRWLIMNGANVNQWDRDSVYNSYMMPLHLFVTINSRSMNGDNEDARSESEQTMRLLLEAGARVSGMDANDMTPLHWAAKVDNLRAAEMLIEAGSKISPRDKGGKQPLDYAESAAMIRLLKNHGAKE